ncbi:universal stress protein [Streptomyces sp. TRM49041]|uniref:universal stress protein n=1 Tax=Streptomyces sp. TRM49041 TaxID=2603216 RepID=UPI0011EEA9D1|nr:universal stress protein [Streptomyces sp. TRM49041]
MNHPTTSGTTITGPVIAGVDGSVQARAAVLWAAAEADRRRQPLRIVYASGTDNRVLYSSAEAAEKVRDAGHDLLTETGDLVAERFPELTVAKQFSGREAVAALREAAGTDGTIVVGHRGVGGFAELLLGSVGLGVAAHAKVPVVVVRGEPEERPGTGVVIAAVRDEHDHGWVRHAAHEAELRKAALRLLTVWNPLSHVGTARTLLDDIDGIARQHVHEMSVLADGLRAEFPELTVTTEVEGGRSTAELLVQATHEADLVVVGAHRPPLGIGRAIGHVTHALLHHAHCPVEIVPRTGSDEEPQDQK